MDTETPLTYRVRPAAPVTHAFEVALRVEEPDPDGQHLSLPAWIPGSYLIRDYARHVVSISATADGRECRLTKLDKSSWRAAPAGGPLLVRMRVHAGDLSVRGAWLDAGHGFFNGVNLFLRVHGQEDRPATVHVDPPEDHTTQDWRLATALPRISGGEFGFGAFRAHSYEHLVDSPVLMGPLDVASFEAGGVPHALVVAGRHEGDMERLRQDLAVLCGAHISLFGGSPPMQRYLFLLIAVASGYGGLEHCDSSALIAARDDLPVVGQSGVADGYRRFLGLVSHEYFHLWNVKRIRPAEFTPYPLDREAYTRQLWVFEGITSYYDDLMLLRAGLVGMPAYLELLGRTLSGVYSTPGRRHQTLEEASFDAWIKFYKRDENTHNATVSYYAKGAMVALALDLEIRLRSDGNASLDDVMRAAWREFGDPADGGLAEGEFEALAADVSGVDLGGFFDQALRSTVDPPVGILLAQFGLTLGFRAAESAQDRGGTPARSPDAPRPWPGWLLEPGDGDPVIAGVRAGGPAEAAGIAAGDLLLALDGQKLTRATLDRQLARLAVGRPATVHLFRRNEMRELQLVPAEPPRELCCISVDANADADAVARREAWLGG